MPKYKKSAPRRYGAKRSRSSAGALAKVVRQLQAATPQAQAQRRARYTRRLYRRYNAPGAAHSTGSMGAHVSQFKSQFPELEGLSNAEIGKMIGQGGYWGRRFGNWLGGMITGNNTIKGLFADAGDMAGDAVASVVPWGSEIAAAGQMLAESIPQFRGNQGGAYQLSEGMSSSAIQVGSFQQGDVETIRIRSREYLGAVTGSAAFRLRSLSLNPGALQTFPMLSRLAMHYEMYRMNGCVFWFHSTSGESTNSADTAIGEVMMANQPDSSGPIPGTKSQMVRLNGAKQAKPSVDQLHGIECAGNGVKFIRHGDLQEANQDPSRFDEGQFHLAVEGCNPLTTRIGELWVTYDVDLIRARDSRGAEVITHHSNFTGVTGLNFFGGPRSVLANSLPVVFGGPGGNNVYFPDFVCDGDYLVSVVLVGTATANAAYQFTGPVLGGLVNCSSTTNVSPGFINNGGLPGDLSGIYLTSVFGIRVDAPGTAVASFQLAGAAGSINGAGGVGQCRIIINKMPFGSITF